MIGLMSGTSLDGLDICNLSFEWHNGNWSFDIHHAETIAYPKELEVQLREAFHWSNEKVHQLDLLYSSYLSDQVLSFIEKHQITRLDAVSSHGHTIWHEPQRQFTKQIGNLSLVAAKTNLNWIVDFRVADIALGGQGAPLVPIGDELLFGDFDYCLNLGGFANISFSDLGSRLAYDICAVNVVLNILAQTLNLNFDLDGLKARSGRCDSELLLRLNQLDFYNQNYPKSLGMEWVEASVWPLLKSSSLSSVDKLATYINHIAYQIGNAFGKKNKKILVSGGGAKNTFLVESISKFTDNELFIPDLQIIDFKEAIVFAFLGVLRLRNEVNCLKSVTGASENHCSGNIFFKP